MLCAIYAVGGGISASIDVEALDTLFTTGDLTNDVTVRGGSGGRHTNVHANSIRGALTTGGRAVVVTQDRARCGPAGAWGSIFAQDGLWWVYASNGVFELAQRVYTSRS